MWHPDRAVMHAVCIIFAAIKRQRGRERARANRGHQTKAMNAQKWLIFRKWTHLGGAFMCSTHSHLVVQLVQMPIICAKLALTLVNTHDADEACSNAYRTLWSYGPRWFPSQKIEINEWYEWNLFLLHLCAAAVVVVAVHFRSLTFAIIQWTKEEDENKKPSNNKNNNFFTVFPTALNTQLSMCVNVCACARALCYRSHFTQFTRTSQIDWIMNSCLQT